MTNNVIKFPQKKSETVDIEDVDDIHKYSLEFAYSVIDDIHDVFHEETGDCIFVDDDYTSLVILLAEVLSGMYLLSQGIDHPTQEIADDLFAHVKEEIDNSTDTSYTESDKPDNEED
jgi:hypothetical protein